MDSINSLNDLGLFFVKVSPFCGAFVLWVICMAVFNLIFGDGPYLGD